MKDQEIILTKNWENEDQVVNMNFSGFQKQIMKVFLQTLMPKAQPFNQGLVIIDQTFQFINMESPLVFETNATFDLKRDYTTLYQIIDQEINFLTQLTSFQSMLHSAKVFTTKTPKTKRHTFNIAKVLEAHKTPFFNPKILSKRSIADIFTPYSVSSIGDTANKNAAIADV